MGKNTVNHDSEYVDTEEVFPEEIPAELLERISENHEHITELHIQVKRGGSWKLLRGGRKVFPGGGAPLMSVFDMCAHLVAVASKDADTNGEGTRYRVRLRCVEGDSAYSRYASIRGFIDGGGALQIVDDEKETEQNAALMVLVRAKEQSDQTSFQAMQVVLRSIQGYSQIADAFNKLLVSAGEVYAKNVGGQAEMMRIQMEMEQNTHQHAEKMQKLDKGFGLLEGPATKIGDEIVNHIVETMRKSKGKPGAEKRSGGRPSAPRTGRTRSTTTTKSKGGEEEPEKVEATVTRCGFAQTLEDVFGTLDDGKKAAAEKFMSTEEWSLIQAAREAQTDPAFDAIFTKFYAELCKRGDEGTSAWVTQISEYVGNDSMFKLGMLIQRVEKARAAAAKAAAQPSD